MTRGPAVIAVVNYDPTWPDRFEELERHYRSALDGIAIVAVEHVGSTAVPGLAAKPVIDVDIVIRPADLAATSAALLRLGYKARGEMGIEHRWAFLAPADVRATNTYVVIGGSVAHRNHIGVRDVLRTDTALRKRYGDLKRRLAEEFDDIDAYVAGKSALLSVILERAGLDAEERALITRANALTNDG